MSKNSKTNKELLEQARQMIDGNENNIFLIGEIFSRICPVCNKEYVLTRQGLIALLKHNHVGCCSKKCAAKNRPKALKNEKELFEKAKSICLDLKKKDGQYIKKCYCCGKEFIFNKNRLARSIKLNQLEKSCCSKSCAAKVHSNSEAEKELRKKRAIEKYGSIENRNKYVFQKQKEGVEKKYGSYSEFMKQNSKKGRETYFKKTGYSHNMRNPKSVELNQEHRVKTLKNFTPEQKEHWYKSRLETMEKNGTSLFGGIRPKNNSYHSKKADIFFDKLNQMDFFKNKKNYFGECEKMITVGAINYFIDFYDETDNIIVEYNGNYWHANPLFYKSSEELNYHGEFCKAQEVWNKDSERKNKIINKLGCKFITVWENDVDNKKFEDIYNQILEEIDEE